MEGLREPPVVKLASVSGCRFQLLGGVEEAVRDTSCPVDTEVSFNTRNEFLSWPVGEDVV